MNLFANSIKYAFNNENANISIILITDMKKKIFIKYFLIMEKDLIGKNKPISLD